MLGAVSDSGFNAPTYKDAFEQAVVSSAPADTVARYVAISNERQSSLTVGKALFTNGDAPVLLKANGFDRHTFLCGQSGSGKTFSLGIILEQLLLSTDLRMVIIDPNSDFVNLNKTNVLRDVNKTRSSPISAKDYKRLLLRYAKVANRIRIMRSSRTSGKNALRVRFSELGPDDQATVMRLDPLADREEFNMFRRIVDAFGDLPFSLTAFKQELANNYSPEARQLMLRINNLGIEDWTLWADSHESALSGALDTDWRCIILDVGSLPSAAEKSVVSAFVLDHFWKNREDRRPVLLVIDEAHNICPSQPADRLQELSTAHAIRIAGEGRKYGLYLMLATQRPTKLHASVVSQCENLILMRMNSRADLNDITEIFSQVPASLLQRAPTFRQGETLVSGRIAQSPTFVKFEGRITREGGSDVPTAWASPISAPASSVPAGRAR
jgi:DNA helicase HerA-like ATPase